MKSPRILVITILQLAGIWVAMMVVLFFGAILVTVFQNRHLVYATSENNSEFIKTYTPKAVVDKFQSKDANSRWSEGGPGAAAGDGFVTHMREFDWTFPMRPEECVPLMTALNEQAATELVRDGAQILSRNGDPEGGFHFEYKLGKNVGSVTISPLHLNKNCCGRIPEGKAFADLDVAIDEQWFVKDPGTSPARISEIMHSINARKHKPWESRATMPCSSPNASVRYE